MPPRRSVATACCAAAFWPRCAWRAATPSIPAASIRCRRRRARMSGNLGNVRLYLWAALALVLFYDYQAWMHDYAPPAAAQVSDTAVKSSPAAAGEVGNGVPDAAQTGAPSVPAAAPATTDKPLLAAPAAADAQVVHVHTDVLDADIS